MPIKRIDIVHHTHTDLGYTDAPRTAHALLAGYIGQAIRLARADPGFAYTCETLLPVWEWWKGASDGQRADLLQAIHEGRIDVMGLPFNITSHLAAESWDRLFGWVPQDVLERLRITAIMQNDVNGMPTGGMLRALAHGIRYLWIGPNTYFAEPPMKTPTAFRWRLAPGKEAIVWLNRGYDDAYGFLCPDWRRGPVPSADDPCFRPPDERDLLRTDEAAMRRAHEQCAARLQTLADYPYDTIRMSMTSHYRMDNDPPLSALPAFVARWNELALQPALRLTTVSRAMADMEREIGDGLPVLEGEWTDWWANGAAAAPVEQAAARRSVSLLRQAASCALGPPTPAERAARQDVLQNACMYGEHTFGSWNSVSEPYASLTLATEAEKRVYAYRALHGAASLLTARLRADPSAREDGVYVYNLSGEDGQGYVVLPANCLRGGPYRSVRREGERAFRPLEYLPGRRNFVPPENEAQMTPENVGRTFADAVPGANVRFWSGVIGAHSRARYELSAQEGESADAAPAPRVLLDECGWPRDVRYEGCDEPLFTAAGDFACCTPGGLSPRATVLQVFKGRAAQERAALAEKTFAWSAAAYQPCGPVQESEHTLTYAQRFAHPSLLSGLRTLEIHKRQRRAALTLTFNRRSNCLPELFYLRFALSPACNSPRVSNAGHTFSPDRLLGGSCRDYFCTDGTVRYELPGGGALFHSHDAPLLVFGPPAPMLRQAALPAERHVLHAMVFDNTWDTNFNADSHGLMSFRFDLRMGGGCEGPAPELWPLVRLYESEA